MLESAQLLAGTPQIGNVLLVSNSRSLAARAMEALFGEGVPHASFTVACTIPSAILRLRTEAIDLVIFALERVDSESLGSLRQLAAVARDAPIVIIGNEDDREHWRHLEDAGASLILGKLEHARSRLAPTMQHLLSRGVVAQATLQCGERQDERLTQALARVEELEADLRQSRRLEAVGRLSCRVAHDFNNLLTAILGFSDLLAPFLEGNDTGLRYVDGISHAGERAAGLTRQLLTFARQSPNDPQPVSINDCITSMSGMLESVLGESIEREIRTESRLWSVTVDRAQIENVIMNLAVNSRDAMPSGGRFQIETANTVIDDEAHHGAGAIAPGNYVVISVSDTGCGMTLAVQERAFDPFYTTKESGKGTGLGLASVRSIVEQAGGRITLHSDPGLGTTFKIFLPSTAIQALPTPAPLPRSTRRAAAERRETILLVEDEALVRNIATEALRGAGYTVIAAPGAHEAMKLALGAGASASLLLTDVVMPKMNGKELADRLLVLRPELRVLYMTGYTDLALFGGTRGGDGRDLLQKPFTQDSLIAKVRELLDRRAG